MVEWPIGLRHYTDEVIGRVVPFTVQKMKFSIKDFFSKCDQIRNFLRIWSYLLKKSLMEKFIFLVQCLQKHILTARAFLEFVFK